MSDVDELNPPEDHHAARHQARYISSPLLAALSFGIVAFRRRHHSLGITQLLTSLMAVGGLIGIVVSKYWVDMVLSPWRLVVGIVVVIAACATAGIAAVFQWLDDGRTIRGTNHRWPSSVGLSVALLAAGAPAVVACYVMIPEIQVARNTFVSAPVAEPHALEPAPTTTGRPTTTLRGAATSSTGAGAATTATSPPTTPLAPAGHSRINVLLLGGDAGPGRFNLRTDSVNLVSIDTTTGDAAIIGVPRNLGNAPLPPGPLRDRWPKGFPDLFNALYPWGDTHPDDVRKALGPTDIPGASLVAASAAELLGVRIDAWILVDMAGFVDTIDALGGIDVFVPHAEPSPGNPPGAKHKVKARIEAGWHSMDGTDALSYARTREADSDYSRMARQRCLLASLVAQKSAADIATHWIGLSKVIATKIRTNLSAGQLKTLLGLAGKAVSHDRSAALTPPLVPEVGWDPALIRQIVADAIADAAGPGTQVTQTTIGTGAAPTTGVTTIGEACTTHE